MRRTADRIGPPRARANRRLDYTGELGIDFETLGAWWGRIVGRKWEATVEATMTAVKAEAERPARRR